MMKRNIAGFDYDAERVGNAIYQFIKSNNIALGYQGYGFYGTVVFIDATLTTEQKTNLRNAILPLLTPLKNINE